MNYERLYEMQKQHRREERIRKFLRNSWLMWIFDSRPYETHIFYPRSIVRNAQREKVRQFFSWHNISRLQNEKAYRVGLVGIITAPIFATLTVSEPFRMSFDFPIQMGFLFFSGISFVLATVIYNLRVPSFVRGFIETSEQKKHKATPIREIHSAIFLEFLKLGSILKVTPENVVSLSHKKTEFEVAEAMLSQGMECYKTGFDTVRRVYVERLLYALAEKHDFKIFEEKRLDNGEVTLKEGGWAGERYVASDLCIHHLHIKSIQECHQVISNPSVGKGSFSENDIVVDFYDASIKSHKDIDKKQEIEPYTLGLETLLREEYLDTIIEELSYWQSWQRPFSRVLSLLMYMFSIGFFSLFLIYQMYIVLSAIELI